MGKEHQTGSAKEQIQYAALTDKDFLETVCSLYMQVPNNQTVALLGIYSRGMKTYAHEWLQQLYL